MQEPELLALGEKAAFALEYIPGEELALMLQGRLGITPSVEALIKGVIAGT